MRQILFFIFILSFLGGTTNSFAQASQERLIIPFQSRASDSLELVNFYFQTRGELWKVKWDLQQPLEDWYGIELNSFGRVFCIDLDGVPDCGPTKNGGNHLHGFFPDLELPFLEHLFLSSNKIGGELPDFYGSPYLLTIQLSGNRLEDSIPCFSHLKNLVKLDLEYNNLIGVIPAFELPKLEALYLGHNLLSGKLPSFKECKNLKHLYLNDNFLKGELPLLLYLSKLDKLILFNNYFTGTLPEYFRLPNLNVLDVHQNQLEGCFPEKEYISYIKFNLDGNPLEPCQVVELTIPTTFSPNGDGVNDYFEIEGFSQLIKNGARVEFFVLNLNHKLVYSNYNYQGDWAGISDNGAFLPQGLYIYSLKSATIQIMRTIFIKK